MRWFLRMGAGVATLCCGGVAVGQTPPVPIDPGMWVTDQDYPTEALTKGEGGLVKVDIDIDSTGKPTGCRTAMSSNSALLDATTCRLMLERGKFRPATDKKERAVAGKLELRFTWQLPPVTPGSSDRTPLKSYAQIARYTLDSQGKIAACSARKVGELGMQMEGCLTLNGEYLLERTFGAGFANSVVTVFSRQEVEGDPLPADAPSTDLPPYWTAERTFALLPDGSFGSCTQRESGKGITPCDLPGKYLPSADGRPKRVMVETRWSWQPVQ